MPDRRARILRALPAILFPLLLWAAATLFLGGNLGKSTDDYSINLRDPATSAIPSPFNPLRRYPYFWRPLHNTLCFTVGTLWPDANRSVHVFVAACHGVAALALFVLLRQLTRTRLAPAAASFLFLTLPLHGEVAFWFCTASTAIGSAIILLGAIIAVRGVRRPAPTIRRTVLSAVSVALLAFVAACWYEQSAALAAAFPALLLGATAHLTWARRLRAATVHTAAAALGCLVYILLLIRTAPDAARGGFGSFVTAHSLPDRIHEFLAGARWILGGERGSDIVLGSWSTGVNAVASPRGLILGGFVLATGVLWVVWAARRGGEPALVDTAAGASQVPARACARGFLGNRTSGRWLTLAGLCGFVGAWLPLLLISGQIVELRSTYTPLLALTLALAAALDGALLRAPLRALVGRTAGRGLIAACAAILALGGAVCLIGYQSFLQARWRQDQREIETLKRLIPDPPPNTVFVPLVTRATATHTGYPLFDRVRHGVFETPWSAHYAVAFAYRRDDLGATSAAPWTAWPATPIDRPGADGARWQRGLSPRLEQLFPRDGEGPPKARRIPWANMVPFVTAPPEQGNDLRLVNFLEAELATHDDLDVRPPIVVRALAAARAAGDLPRVERFRFPAAPEASPELIPVEFWRYADGSPAQFVNVHPWGLEHRATWLAADGGPRASMSVQMPPSDRPERLLIRATISDYDLDPKRFPPGRSQTLWVTAAADPQHPLATLHLDPAAIGKRREWLPFIVNLPPRAAATGDRIIITLHPADPPQPTSSTPTRVPPVWVTHGFEQSIPAP